MKNRKAGEIMKNLKRLREKQELTQEQLAKQVGVSQANVAMWETGKSKPTLDMAYELAKIFDCSIDYLLGKDEKPKATSEPSCGFWEIAERIGCSVSDLLNPKRSEEELELIKAFGERLKALRNERLLTQQDVADVIGMSQQAYAFYETGQREPSLKTLITIATFFDCTVDYLIGVSDERHGHIITKVVVKRIENKIKHGCKKRRRPNCRRAYQLTR